MVLNSFIFIPASKQKQIPQVIEIPIKINQRNKPLLLTIIFL